MKFGIVYTIYFDNHCVYFEVSHTYYENGKNFDILIIDATKITGEENVLIIQKKKCETTKKWDSNLNEEKEKMILLFSQVIR